MAPCRSVCRATVHASSAEETRTGGGGAAAAQELTDNRGPVGTAACRMILCTERRYLLAGLRPASRWMPCRRCGRQRFCRSTRIGLKTRTPAFPHARVGYRFYEPNLQRWLNRDPIEERGGINLYAFVANDAVRRVDPAGLIDRGSPSFPINRVLPPGYSWDLPTLEDLANWPHPRPGQWYGPVPGVAIPPLDWRNCSKAGCKATCAEALSKAGMPICMIVGIAARPAFIPVVGVVHTSFQLCMQMCRECRNP
jgi:RHS repeat-associated protein